MPKNIYPADLKKMIDAKEKIFILDVREPFEVAESKIPGSTNISTRILLDNLDKLPKDRLIVVYCAHGTRSRLASAILENRGFSVANMAGGMAAWDELE